MRVSKNAYYHWLNNKEILKVKSTTSILKERIEAIFIKNRQIYGSHRIQKKLEREGLIYSRSYISLLMKQMGLKSVLKRKFVSTTDSNHTLPIAVNQLNREFSSTKIGEKWVSDITYIRVNDNWNYLTTIIDLADRKVVGWSMSNTMTAQLVIDALHHAIIDRKPVDGLIFHSDRGSQYASIDFRKMLSNCKIIQSMSGKGNCYDNAVAESFFHTLKTELVYWEKYKTRNDAKSSIFQFIEGFYNRRRRHSYLNYFSPFDFELLYFKFVA